MAVLDSHNGLKKEVHSYRDKIMFRIIVSHELNFIFVWILWVEVFSFQVKFKVFDLLI